MLRWCLPWGEFIPFNVDFNVYLFTLLKQLCSSIVLPTAATVLLLMLSLALRQFFTRAVQCTVTLTCHVVLSSTWCLTLTCLLVSGLTATCCLSVALQLKYMMLFQLSTLLDSLTHFTYTHPLTNYHVLQTQQLQIFQRSFHHAQSYH